MHDPLRDPRIDADDVWEQYGRRVAVQMRRGNRAASLAIVNEAHDEWDRTKKRPEAMLLTDIVDTHSSSQCRVAAILQREGICYVWQFLNTNRHRLLEVKGIADSSLEMLLERLEKIGVHPPEDESPIQTKRSQLRDLRLSKLEARMKLQPFTARGAASFLGVDFQTAKRLLASERFVHEGQFYRLP
jgi:hypothetical protein